MLKTFNELLTGTEILVTSGMTGDLLRNIDAATPIIHAGEFRAIGTAFATSSASSSAFLVRGSSVSAATVHS